MFELKKFEELYKEPSRNGLSRSSEKNGKGTKIINMGELFMYPRMKNPEMRFVESTEKDNEIFGIEAEDLLFARRSLVVEGAGKCSIVLEVEKPTVFESSIIRVRLNNELCSPLFYYYYFTSEVGFGAIQTLVNEVAASGIRSSELAKLKVIYPKPRVQQRIASILNAYDELIEVNNQRIKLLEETARELYKEWFVRMRFPGYKEAKFVKGLPVGWGLKSLFDVAEVTYGFPFQSELFNEKSDGLPVIRIRDLIGGVTETYTTEVTDEKYFALDGDILVGMDGDFHFCKWAGVKAWINQRNVRFRPKKGTHVSKYFLYHVTKPQIEFLNEIIVGTTVAHLSATDLKRMKLLIPPDDLLIQFKKNTDPIYEQEIILKKQNTQLRQIRDRLLPRLVSGKLAVKT